MSLIVPVSLFEFWVRDLYLSWMQSHTNNSPSSTHLNIHNQKIISKLMHKFNNIHIKKKIGKQEWWKRIKGLTCLILSVAAVEQQ